MNDCAAHTCIARTTQPHFSSAGTFNVTIGDWRVSILGVKGVKAAFDTVELTLEGKTSTFDVEVKGSGNGEEVSDALLYSFSIEGCNFGFVPVGSSPDRPITP